MPCPTSQRPFLIGALVLLLLTLTGCAGTPQSARLRGAPPPDLPLATEITAAPFFPQEAYQCGPAALATVLVHAGVHTDPAALAPQVFLPEREGSLQLELIAATRRQGHVPYVLAPRLADLLKEVSAGHPVLVLQNLALDWAPRWHYAVVVGFDLAEEVLVLRSGRVERHVVALNTFEHTWRRGGHWALVVAEPHQPPVTAETLPWLRAVAAFESLGDAATAHRGYAAATRRWPENIVAWLALGNASHAQDDMTTAEQAFRQAVTIAPNHAAALNNLAQTLADQGRYAEAMDYARRAVIAGNGAPAFTETLEAIRATTDRQAGHRHNVIP